MIQHAPQYILLVTTNQLTSKLNLEGYHPIYAYNGEIAWQMFQQYRPALVIMDAALRGFDPVEFCQRIRAEPQGEQYGLLCVVAPKPATRIEQLMEAGADDVLLTPMIDRLLRQRAANILELKAHKYLTNFQNRLLEWFIEPAFICALDGRLSAINDLTSQLLGHRRAELIGANIFDLTTETSIEIAQLWDDLNAGQSVKFHARFRRKNLVQVPVEVQIKPMENGYFLGLVRDLSEHLQTQVTLQESEHKYRDLFNSANDAILIVDLVTGRFLNANKRAARWLGYSQEELLQLSFDEIDVPMSQQQQEQVRKELSTNGRLIYEQFYRTKDGSLMPVEVSSRLIRYEGRRAFLCFARDITKRREMETAERSQRLLAEALRASAAALNSSLDFNQIVEKMLELIDGVVTSEAANVAQIMGDQVKIVAQRGYDKRGLSDIWGDIHVKLAEAPIYVQMQKTKQPVFIPDVAQHKGWFKLEIADWVRSYVGAPIIVGGKVMGFINLDGDTPHQFNEHHAETLMAFANQAGIAIHNAQLFGAIQLYAGELEQRVRQRTAQLSDANDTLKEQIAERERAEIALAEERNLLRTLINNLPDHVYVKDLEGNYMVVNKSLRERLEYHNPPSDDEKIIFETGQPSINQETITFDQDGNQRWLMTTKVPLHDQHGNIIGVVGVDRDITALRGAEEQLAYVVTGANCLLWYAVVEKRDDEFIWDLHISSETAARRFLPLQEDFNLSYVNAWQNSILEEDAARRKETSQLAMVNNYNGYSHEYRCRRADGQLRWLYEEVRIRPLFANRWSLVGICTDITERKQASQALQTAYDQLDQRVKERTAELSQANSGLKLQIAERRRIEKALRESEARFRALVEHAPEAIVVFDVVSERYVDVNENAAKLFGVSQAQLLTLGPLDFSPELQPDGSDSIQMMRQKIRDAVNGETSVFDWVYRNNRAREIICEVRLLLLPTSGTLLVRGSITDITARVLIQRAEQEQRLLAQALRDAAADLSRTLDLDEMLDRMLLYITQVMPPHESASILLIEDDQDHVRTLRSRNTDPTYNPPPREPMRFSEIANWQQMYETQQPVAIPDTQGHPAWKKRSTASDALRSYVGAPILAEGGVIGFINLGSLTPGIFTEEHAHRLLSFANQVGIAIQNARLYAATRMYALEMEKRVVERTAELDNERTRLRAILDAMTEGVIYHDQDSTVLYTNRSLFKITGLEEDELYTTNIPYDLMQLPPYKVDAFIQEVVQGLAKSNLWRGRIKIHHKDGTELDVSMVTTLVYGVDGNPIGSVTVMRDISAETKLENQKKRFIAVASHELRTPLTNLKTRLYLIRRQPERLEAHLDVLDAVTERMQKLVEDLFDVSRFEHGLIPLKPGINELQPLILDVVNLQQTEAERKDIRLTYLLPNEPLVALVDPPRFVQVLTNLVTNALNYTSAGGEVTVEAEIEQDEIAVSVRDTGIGIPEEWLDQIWQPFFRGSEISTGAGLGLSIAREIVELHGGRITVDSVVGAGTCFKVWLPALTKIKDG